MTAFFTNFRCEHKGANSYLEEFYLVVLWTGDIVVCGKDAVQGVLANVQSIGGVGAMLPNVRLSVPDFRDMLKVLKSREGVLWMLK